MMKALQKKSLFVKTQMFQVIDYYVAIGTINSYIDKMEEHHWQNYMHRLLPVCQNRKFKIEEHVLYVGDQFNTVVASLFPSANVTKQYAAVNMLSSETSLQSLATRLGERALSERILFISRIP